MEIADYIELPDVRETLLGVRLNTEQTARILKRSKATVRRIAATRYSFLPNIGKDKSFRFSIYHVLKAREELSLRKEYTRKEGAK